MAKRSGSRRASAKSVLTAKDFHLNQHDEDKLLLFAAGILLGIGLSVTVFLDKLWYGGLVAIALGVVLLLIEKRQ